MSQDPLPDRRDGGSLAKIAAIEDDEVNGRSRRRLLLHRRRRSHATPGEADFRNHEPAATLFAQTTGTVASALGRRPAQEQHFAASPLNRRRDIFAAYEGSGVGASRAFEHWKRR